MSAEERTGWRDLWLSGRHRLWGFNCPAVDFDFLLVEYNHGLPVAIVEYKHRNARPVDADAPSITAVREIAHRAHLPFWVAIYDREPIWFEIMPMNEAAAAEFAQGERLSERDYVLRLYRIRNLTLMVSIRDRLSAERPPVPAGPTS